MIQQGKVQNKTFLWLISSENAFSSVTTNPVCVWRRKWDRDLVSIQGKEFDSLL